MPRKNFPDFPYGAVYFRWSSPPKADWERDYQTAEADGTTAFRHWFLWSTIETAPGVFEWKSFDRHLDLAAKHGIKTIIAERTRFSPEWTYRDYAHARAENREGQKLSSQMAAGCATGGTSGMCLDNDDYRDVAETWLRTLAGHYRGHPGLGGYDVWNECGMGGDVCYCQGTAARFRDWLRDKYGDLKTLGEVWYRPSYCEWEDVVPPRQRGPYPDVLDWLQFRIENAHELMAWRIATIRDVDPDVFITAHGVAKSLSTLAPSVHDDWRAAAEVENYGVTWGSPRHGDEAWKQMHGMDLIRAASRGKPFWHAEAYGGPLWMAPHVQDRPRDDGRITFPEDIRFWNLTSYMCGATGTFFLRWRPLLDGPLFGAFGPYGMDGSRTDRSEMSKSVAEWVAAPQQSPLWESRPIRGQVGIVFVPETQIYNYAQQGDAEWYAQSMRGAYQAFFDQNIQADWVRIDHIDEYDLLYLPFPIMLTQASVGRLKAWIKAGGTLVSEGCPGYHGDRGRVGITQPNLGLDEVFGALETYVEFTPDLLEDLELTIHGQRTRGGVFLQAYETTTGTAVGWYDHNYSGSDADDGAPRGVIAAVDNTYGKGRTRLIGTMAGYGYAAHTESRSPAFFADIMSYAGKATDVTSSETRIKTRLHDGDSGTYLWVANPTRQDLPVVLVLSDKWGPYRTTHSLWGSDAAIDGRTVTLIAPARNISVIRLDK